jgi:hypothetical protein
LIKKVDSDIGEAFEFHNEKLLCYGLNASSLHEIVTREDIEMCIALDDAVLYKDLSHLTFILPFCTLLKHDNDIKYHKINHYLLFMLCYKRKGNILSKLPPHK